MYRYITFYFTIKLQVMIIFNRLYCVRNKSFIVILEITRKWENLTLSFFMY